MDPVTALAAAELKRRLWRVVRRVLAVVLPVLLVGALAMGVFTSALFAGDSSGDEESAPVGCAVIARPAPVDIGSLDAEQLANAQTIVAVGRALGVPSRGWVIALSTALQESTLRNLPYGDRDSIGLFQQRDAWGSRADRLDPATSSRMFFTGGRGGQRGLLSVPDYLDLPVTRAAQAVQVSAFPDAYAKWEGLARQLAGTPSIAACGMRVRCRRRGWLEGRGGRADPAGHPVLVGRWHVERSGTRIRQGRVNRRLRLLELHEVRVVPGRRESLCRALPVIRRPR